MILHPAIVALVLVSLLVTGMVLYSAFFGIGIVRRWDLQSGSEQQLVMERRTYLISTILSYVFLFQIGSLFLYIYTAESLHTRFVGAMCAAGSLNVNPYGYPAFLLKILNVILAGLWLIINAVDNRAFDYPLIRKKYAMLLILAPLIMAESVVQMLYFIQLKADVITSCCGSLFGLTGVSVGTDIAAITPAGAALKESIAQTLNASQITPGMILSCCESLFNWEALTVIATVLATMPVKVAMTGFYLCFALTFSSGTVYYIKGKLGGLFAIAGGLFFLVACISFVSFISLYFYELPTHHCPFCVLQREYGYVGYLLYAALLAGVVSGLGVGALMPFAGISSLSVSLPRIRKRLTLLCLASYFLFTGISIYRVVSTDFTLGLL
jgi:hypothetical protein